MSSRKRPELPERSSSLNSTPTEMILKRHTFDWISQPRSCILTPFQQSIIDVDWEKSPLGSMKSWPTQLRHMVLLIVADTSAAAVFWGNPATIVYNESYAPMIGLGYPVMQGQDSWTQLADVWESFDNILATQRETGLTAVQANQFLLMTRNGFPEETYFNTKFVPIIGDSGFVVGSHLSVLEVTREVIFERRSLTARALGREIASASDINELWSKILCGLKKMDKDVPLALLYSIGNMSKNLDLVSAMETPEKTIGSIMCNFEGSLGLPDGHPIAPITFDVLRDKTCLAKTFRNAMKGPNYVPLRLNDEFYAESRLEGIPWRGYGPPNSMVVCPISSTYSDCPVSFLVMALNPIRPYDEGYQSFIQLLTEQITTPQISTILFREEFRKRLSESRREAINRAVLSQELTSVTLEFRESEIKFARFAARAEVGLAIFDLSGFVLYANKLWRDLIRPDLSLDKVLWEKSIVAQDLDFVKAMFQRLEGQPGLPATFQFRVKRPWRTPTPDKDGNYTFMDTHLQCSATSDMDDNRNITLMCCLTDVSEFKWIEGQLRQQRADVEQKMHQAIETKEQQERFIDMISHEMRNPLSAMIHCADMIITSMNDCGVMMHEEKQGLTKGLPLALSMSSPKIPVPSLDLLKDVLDAADTIMFCAMHQKRIADDTLTLSRLDANLLDISPVAEQPIPLVLDAIKMFNSELKSASISLEVIKEASLLDLKIRWILIDPSRFLQVFINLMTNAIKFTRTESHRKIKIEVGASLVKPSELSDAVEYIPETRPRRDNTLEAAWGQGEMLYLTVSIRDSGRGLSKEEREHIFQIFQQSSPKTYARYGGSGLGLFISRQLVEMQGGQIYLSSEAPGMGTIVKFFIKSRRTDTSPRVTPTKEIQSFMPEGSLSTHCVVGSSTPREVSRHPECPVPTTTDPPVTLSTSSTDLHVLVVEDNLINQKVISKQLRKSGCIVTVANNGEEALQFIMRSEHWKDYFMGERLSVILMDLEMPVMDGISALQNIRRMQAEGRIIRHIPVIAVTANARKDKIEEARNAGMDDITTKPYRIQDILEQIKRVIDSQ